tara:strand:+ start:1447 stop:2142 length:696 start_codon:yes stop_codon:yes gene_type:complete
MRLSVVGKKYLDLILEVDQFTHNETNRVHNVTERLGGLYNILTLDLGDHSCISPTIEGVKRAIVVNEKKPSQRSSLTWDKINLYSYDLPTDGDWIHVMYIDDVDDPNKFMYCKSPFSIDFCTDTDRTRFSSIINSSELVFDSRERKHLYDNISTNTPLVFHDKYGCEVVIENEIVFSYNNEPIDVNNINGAGDIFSAFFIKEYTLSNFENACKIATKKTVSELVRRQNEKV